LQLADFIGYNDKAVKWQVWIGLMTHLLLCCAQHNSRCALFMQADGLNLSEFSMTILNLYKINTENYI